MDQQNNDEREGHKISQKKNQKKPKTKQKLKKILFHFTKLY